MLAGSSNCKHTGPSTPAILASIAHCTGARQQSKDSGGYHPPQRGTHEKYTRSHTKCHCIDFRGGGTWLNTSHKRKCLHSTISRAHTAMRALAGQSYCFQICIHTCAILVRCCG